MHMAETKDGDMFKTPKVPAIFGMFKPNRIEYVCNGNETEGELDRLLERGLTPVIVKKMEEPDGEEPCSAASDIEGQDCPV